MERFLKGIVVGLGGVAPGLSGSVLLIIFGLYRQTLDALGSLLKDFKKNIRFLLPLVVGMVLGVLAFSKVVHFCLNNYEMPTRFCFLGLILGTLPMVWQEVKKEGFSRGYYFVIAMAAALGIWFFTVNPNAFPQVTDPSLAQKIILGGAVAMTAIVPGVDPAVFLSTLGLYELYVTALATLDVTILLPMLIGVAGGAVAVSAVMSALFRRLYTATFSVIFGIFLSMIPNMLSENCRLGFNGVSVVSLVLAVLGFLVSWYLGDMEGANRKLKNLFGRKREK
jgi:putative membrane protein